MIYHSPMFLGTTDEICELGWKSMRNRDDTESKTEKKTDESV